ncbi:MAG: HD domain-containing protein [Clostridia bacterium]|nr:HD domain-containing protein [Clostridia bacterium]
MITYNDIKNNEAINTYIKKADESLKALGFTEHSFAHVGMVSTRAEYILKTLGYDSHQIDLVKIAAYLHDIGNVINRKEHSQSGAIMAFRILDKLEMPPQDIATIITAIGNHDEGTGEAVNAVAAALIIADKSDVRRSRVRNRDVPSFDIHDRVNYSVINTSLTIDKDKTKIVLSLTIDTLISPVIDYFEIFLTRMLMCKKAAKALSLEFKLMVNGQELI